MKQIKINVPADKEEQRAISQILGALDDKIENNTKINHQFSGLEKDHES
jgi:type I restriction enzyme S subunit